MFSKIREIVLRLFLFYFILFELRRSAHLSNSHNSQKNGLFHFFRFLSLSLTLSLCVNVFFTISYMIIWLVLLYMQNVNLNTHRQTSGNKIKMPFSIRIYTNTYPLLCKMNSISIIIINVVRGHNGGKHTHTCTNTEGGRERESQPFHCIILTHFNGERRDT